MPLIDTHAHLDFDTLQDRFDEVLANARDNGVERIVTIGASDGMASNERALKLAEEYDNFRCTVGIHPHDADIFDEETFGTIRDTYAEHPQVVGIGETGLDYFYDNAEVDNQKASFRAHLELAKQVDKPVVIHSRDADKDTIEILEDMDVTGGILHCFTGSRWMAERLHELDFYISFSGIVTFKNSKELLEIAANTSADRILVETDSPFLAPVPHRGETNEPAYVRHTAQKIAEARGMSLKAFSNIVWDNATRVFNWE